MPSPDPETEALRRESIVMKAVELIASGEKKPLVARRFGISRGTLDNWTKFYNEEGIDGLYPRQMGRPKVAEFNDLELGLAKFYRLTKESIPVAAHFFASDKRVRGEVRQAIVEIVERSLETGKAEAWPMSIRRAFYVSESERADFRGKKHSQEVEMVTRRGMFEVLADGTHRDILPGDVWELDDYSGNQPYTFADPVTGEIQVGRQILASRDLSAAFWMGFDAIGRERDAYRAEDVLRFIERLIRVHGLPRKLRLERGIWESSGVHGVKIKDAQGNETDKRWGDLAELVEIEHVFKSKGKAIIEGGFNVLQRWLGHTGTDIGRVRGEFEEATKRLRQAKSTGADPRELGFLSQERCAEAHAEAMKIINSRPMMRRHLNERVAPDDLVARQGWNTREFDDALAWYFMPVKQNKIVRGGHVDINPGGGWPEMRIAVNGVVDGLYLENGYRVLVACDPARPHLGARIANRETGAKNREGYRVGECMIATAPVAADAPQFNASGVLDPNITTRKKAQAASRTHFRGIVAASRAESAEAWEMSATDGGGRSASAGSLQRDEPTVADSPQIPRRRDVGVGNDGAIAPRFKRFDTSEKRQDEIRRLKAKHAEADY